MPGKPLIAVAGVTAAGKTALGIGLSLAFSGEVVSADSMQVYRGMEIAAAAPTAHERAQAPHHLVGFLDPGQEFSVADYAALARKTIADIHSRGKVPVVVGGTGLYMGALLDGIRFDSFPGDTALRAALCKRAREEGAQALYEELRQVDAALCGKLHPNNAGRVIRALEVYYTTGVPMSEHQRRAAQEGSGYAVCAMALDFRDREKLRARIDARVDKMAQDGLVEEARRFYEGDPARTARAAIGYKELDGYLKGEMELGEALQLVKLRTRQYAKRQRTWFKRDARFEWIYADEYPDAACILEKARQIVKSSCILQNF